MPQPKFDDAKFQKSWNATRDMAHKSAPQVDILLGDYLLSDSVSVGELSRIKMGTQENSVLSLTYRFSGALGLPSVRSHPPISDLSLYLRGSSRGKERTKKQIINPLEFKKIASMASPAPLSPHYKKWAPKFGSGGKCGPPVKKSIIIQHSSKPPIEKSIILKGRRNGKMISGKQTIHPRPVSAEDGR
eukprot:sb/3471261/